MRRSKQAKLERKLTNKALEYAYKKVLTSENISKLVAENVGGTGNDIKDKLADQIVEIGNKKLDELKNDTK